MEKNKLVEPPKSRVRLKKLEEEYTIILYNILKKILASLLNGSRSFLMILINFGGSIPPKSVSQKLQRLKWAMEMKNLLKLEG